MVLVALGASPALAACGRAGVGAVRPVPIQSGDTCARCGMLITDLREAAEILGTRSQVWKFDDLGEMFAFYQEHHLAPADVKAMFVHDYHTREWIPAEQATYVVSPELHTPMDFDLAAFAGPAAAKQFAADRRGTVHAYAELLQAPPRPGSSAGTPASKRTPALRGATRRWPGGGVSSAGRS